MILPDVAVQLTPASVESFRTVAVKLCVAPPSNVTVAGVTETEIWDGGGVEVLGAPPQPVKAIKTERKPQEKQRDTLLNMETLSLRGTHPTAKLWRLIAGLD